MTIYEKIGTRVDWPDHCWRRARDLRIQTFRTADQIFISAEKSPHSLISWYAISSGSWRKIGKLDHRRLRHSDEKTGLCDSELHLFTDQRGHLTAYRDRLRKADFWSPRISRNSFRFQTYFFQLADYSRTHRPGTMTSVRSLSQSVSGDPKFGPSDVSGHSGYYPVAYHVGNQVIGVSRRTGEVCASVKSLPL